MADVLNGGSQTNLHRVFTAEPALGCRSDFAGLAQQIGEIGPGVFEAVGIDVGDVVAFDIHRDLVGLQSGYAGP